MVWRLAAVAAVAAVVAGATGSAEDVNAAEKMSWVLEEELWYALRMQNTSAGVLRCSTERSGGLVRTLDDMTVKINRGEDSVRLWFVTEMVEDTATGRVLRAGYTQQMAEDTIRMDYEFGDSEVRVTSVQSGKTHKSTLPPISGAHLGRHAVREHIRAEIGRGTDAIEYVTIKPEMGAKLHRCSMAFLRHEHTAVREVVQNASVWDTTIEGMPVRVTEWMSEGGDVVRMLIDSGAGVIEAVLSTKASAEDAAAAETAAPELVDSTHVLLAHPSPELHAWSGAKAARYTVWSKNGQPLELPTAGFQRVTAGAGDDGGSGGASGRLTVRVDLRDPVPVTPAELSDMNYISPSAMIDSTDTAVRAVAERAVGELFTYPLGPRSDAEVLARARRLRDAVKAHFTAFNLKTGYASASEAARRGEGDCSEHGVLLAAVLRADGIPSRVCSGIVYTERAAHSYLNAGDGSGGGGGGAGAGASRGASVQGSFAWHAWTQALVGGKWVDLDATLHSSPYSVGHVLMGTSGMDDGAGHADEMVMVSMIGNLEMVVEEVA